MITLGHGTLDQNWDIHSKYYEVYHSRFYNIELCHFFTKSDLLFEDIT